MTLDIEELIDVIRQSERFLDATDSATSVLREFIVDQKEGYKVIYDPERVATHLRAANLYVQDAMKSLAAAKKAMSPPTRHLRLVRNNEDPDDSPPSAA